MPMKIGFINFTSFDLIKATDLVGLRQSLRPLQPGNKILSIGETHQTRSIAFSLDATATHGAKPRQFPTDYHPLLNEYHEVYHKEAVRRDMLRRIAERRKMLEADEKHDHRLVLEHHDWMIDLIMTRIYQRVGRMKELFDRVALREWDETKKHMSEHVDKRVNEKEKFPRLFKKDSANPYRYEIKLPNQVTLIDEFAIKVTHDDSDKSAIKNELEWSRDRFHQLRTEMAKSKWLAQQRIFQEQRMFHLDKANVLYDAKTMEEAQDTIDQSQILKAVLRKQK